MAKRPPPISEQVRRAIKDCGISRYQLSRLAQIDESHLAKFFIGTRALGQDSLDRLGQVLGLRVVPDNQPKRKS